MTNEDKNLLLIDLAGRLPYMPKVRIEYQQYGVPGVDIGNVSFDFIEKIVNDLRNGVITDMKIYLRPMSSMTEDEKRELKELHFYYTDAHIVNDEDDDFKPIIVDEIHCSCIIDWLNKNGFDYRGLIEKGIGIIEAQD